MDLYIWFQKLFLITGIVQITDKYEIFVFAFLIVYCSFIYRHQGVYPQPQQEWGISRLEGGQWGTFLDQPFVQQTLSTVKRTPRLFAVQ